MAVTYDAATARSALGGRGAVVTIGAYDGVHRGHRSVIDEVRRLAADRDCASAVVTFDRHPAAVVRPESAPCCLVDLEQKLALLDASGVDLVFVIHFDTERASETAEDFVNEVLIDALQARAVVVGHDFHFGRDRGGNVELLARKGAVHGFDVLGLRLLGDGTEAVSSTRIRRLLSEGDVAAAGELLGRAHQVDGTVAHGDKRGRELGFPTANVVVPTGICLPADGIYAAWFDTADGTPHAAAVSLGRRPTFYDDAEHSVLEAYLLDFDGDLYDQRASVRFVARLRSEAKFTTAAALVEQMHRDVAATRASLSPG